MAKSEPQEEGSTVIGTSPQGVAIYKEGMHPKDLRRKADEAARAAAEEAEEATPQIPERTKAQLKARLDELGVEYPEKANRTELLALVTEAEAAPEE